MSVERVDPPGRRRIDVGSGPHSVVVTPDGRRAYVSLFAANAVAVVDLVAGRTVHTIPVGASPNGVALNPDASRLFVAAKDSDTLSIIDTATGAAVLGFGIDDAPYGLAAHPDGRFYASLALTDAVLVTDGTGKPSTRHPDVPFAVGLAFDARRTLLYAANYFADTITVLRVGSEAVPTAEVTATVPVERGPYGLAVGPDASTLYVTHFPYEFVSAIDLETWAQQRTFAVPDGPRGVAVDPTGRTLYVTNGLSTTLSVVPL